MFIKDGKRINIDVPFTDPDTGRKGIRLTDPAERERYGITEIAEPLRKNEEFYYVQTLDVAPYVLNTPKPLDMVKENLIKKVKAIREDYWLTGGCFFEGVWYHNDMFSSIQQITLAVIALAGGANNTVEWKTMYGTKVTLTLQKFLELIVVAAERGKSIFAIAETKEAEINALTSIEELETYNVQANWPLVYEAQP
jgi:hypothetical protein